MAEHGRETATHVYFLRGPFSQWYPSRFSAPITQDGLCLTFNCAEQYMMASKAALFGDSETLAQIMAVQPDGRSFHHVPLQQKALGRQVRGFIDATWHEVARRVVFRGNLAKFSQDAGLRDMLFATGDRVLVEGSAKDRLWGVGIAWDDPAIEDQTNWRGSNWLGQVLVGVRAALRDASPSGSVPSMPW